MKLTKFFALALAAIATFAFVGCGSDDETNAPFSGSLFLTADKESVSKGETVQFIVTDSDGNNVTSRATIYDSNTTKYPGGKFVAKEK